MKIATKICLAASLLSIASCAFPRPSSGPGFFYTDVTEGIFANSSVEGRKTGEVCNSNILGIVSTGDASIDAVKRQSSVRNIATIDRTYFGVLGVYAKSCTIVKGN